MLDENMDEPSQPTESASGGETKQSVKKDRSTIEFPYMPLESAKEVATALYNRCGFGSCDQDELAAEMKQTLSGAFRAKTSAAKIFGLVDKDGRSAFSLSDLGKQVISHETESAALVEAFLTVPLYRAIYDKFRGHNLPPAKALEREIEGLGVAPKQTDRARQAFERSAEFAGFFSSGKERLVRPRLESSSPAPSSTEQQKKATENERLDSGPEKRDNDFNIASKLDPIIRGLIDRLPASGSEWPQSERKLWLDILENSFKLVYRDVSQQQSKIASDDESS